MAALVLTQVRDIGCYEYGLWKLLKSSLYASLRFFVIFFSYKFLQQYVRVLLRKMLSDTFWPNSKSATKVPFYKPIKHTKLKIRFMSGVDNDRQNNFRYNCQQFWSQFSDRIKNFRMTESSKIVEFWPTFSIDDKILTFGWKLTSRLSAWTCVAQRL